MSASNIVPYYSSSPPPLDEDDDTAHSLDDNDDDFGDFSSAPTSVGIAIVKAPAKESAFFRPISKNLQPDPLNDDHFAGDYQSNESPPISVTNDKPISFSPVFSNDQFAKDHQKDDPFPGCDDALHSISKEQVAIEKIAANESEISPELNCQKETNKLDIQNFEKTSDLCDSADFGGEYVSHSKNPVRNVEFERDVHADHCSITDFVSINSVDTTEPDVLKDSSDLSSVQDINQQDVVVSAEDEFDDFETFQGESAFKDSQLKPVDLEHTAEVSANRDQENFVIGDPDDERDIKSKNDRENFQLDDVEFDDFEYFPDEFPVKSDSAVNTVTSNDVEISPVKVQDDVTSDTADSDGKIDAADDFDEFESAQELDKFELSQQTAAEESHLDSVAPMADSSDGEISYKPDDDEITADTSREDAAESLESRATNESTEEISFKNEIGDIQTSTAEAVQPEELDEMTSSSADDKQKKNCDFDEFDDFQFADDEVVNPPSTDTMVNISGSVPATVKTDDTSSSWSAFSKEPASEVTSESSWAAFNADTNVSSDVVRNERQTTASTSKEPNTTAMDWKEGPTKSTVDESQVEGKFELLTSGVATNCYPLVREKDIMQLQLLLDVISQTQDLTDNSSKSPSTYTASKDSTTGESKSCPPDVCVWNNLKMMDLTSAFGFQWPTSSISRNLLSAINVDLSSILVGKKPPLFAHGGLLEPMKAVPTELPIAQADPLTFTISDSSSSSSVTMSSAFSPQDVPQLEFDWGGSGLTNPLDAGNSFQLDLDFFVMSDHNSMVTLVSEATEKERELLDALEPPANESSMKMPPMSLETMLATLLPSIPSTQRIPKSEKDIIDRKHLSEEAIQVLSKLPDLSFMQAKVLMFPLKDIAGS